MKKLRYAGVLTAVALALAGCGGQKVGEDKPAAAGKDCGTFNLTVSPWVGYEANAAVVSYVEMYWLISMTSGIMFVCSFLLKRNEPGRAGKVSVH